MTKDMFDIRQLRLLCYSHEHYPFGGATYAIVIPTNMREAVVVYCSFAMR